MASSYTPRYGGWLPRGSQLNRSPLGGGQRGGTVWDPSGRGPQRLPPQGSSDTWGQWGTRQRYDPTTGNTYVEANPAPINPRDEEDAYQRNRTVAYGTADRNAAMRAAQEAEAVARGLDAAWSVGPTGEVTFQGIGRGSMSGATSGSTGGSSRGDTQAIIDLIKQYLSQTPAPVTHPGGGQSSEAAFARAKERAAQSGRAALNALYDIGAATGRAGSPLEAGLASQTAQQGQGELADFLREQAIYDATRQGQVNDLTYQGNITQRGQDLERQMQLISALLSAYGSMY